MATLTLSAPTGATTVTITGEAQAAMKNISFTLPTGLTADPSNPTTITSGTACSFMFAYNPKTHIFNRSNFITGMRDLGDYGQPSVAIAYDELTELVTVTYTLTPYFNDSNSITCNISSSLYTLTFNLTGVTVSCESIDANAVVTYSVIAQSGYNLPSTITVNGATHTWR